MKLRLVALAVAAAAVLSPQSSTARLYTYYVVPGGTSYVWQSVVIDPPLKLTVDAGGQAHLGISTSRKYAVSATWNGSAWVLPDIPRIASLECSLNGLNQTPAKDYTISGRVMSFFLEDLDPAETTVTCSYDR